jgi:methanogenic corrinoid protein MtbC1
VPAYKSTSKSIESPAAVHVAEHGGDDGGPMTESDVLARLRSAIGEGDAARAAVLAREAADAGIDPLLILERGVTDSLRFVGECWERGDLFLPEMMLAAEAAKAGLATLKPRLLGRAGGPGRGVTCVLGTVRGDIHDIGKNIVGTLLEAFGFRIVDLGTDVAPDRFVGAVRETGAALVGLSALLTSTMPGMRSVIEALEQGGLRGRVRVAVGGAPLGEPYAREIGADGYAEDGMGALRLFQRLAGAEEATGAA